MFNIDVVYMGVDKMISIHVHVQMYVSTTLHTDNAVISIETVCCTGLWADILK